jgi:hypothetical protein
MLQVERNSIKNRQDKKLGVRTNDEFKKSNKSNSKKVSKGDSEREEKIV